MKIDLDLQANSETNENTMKDNVWQDNLKT